MFPNINFQVANEWAIYPLNYTNFCFSTDLVEKNLLILRWLLSFENIYNLILKEETHKRFRILCEVQHF